MAFGVYIHIPFCIQKCSYCDFATLPQGPRDIYQNYVSLLAKEIQSRSKSIPFRELDSLYFGGGTPSLLDAEDILYLRDCLANVGFVFSKNLETTIEINPGTVDQRKLDLYRAAGVNRLSVGVQTFDDSILKNIGREHSAEDSRSTLALLRSNSFNYTADIMFGLPRQSEAVLAADIEEILSFSPNHISFYNLTIPENHTLNAERPPDAAQAEMFEKIDFQLSPHGIFRYELSNFAKPGFESKHNSLYWTGGSYWGIGLSAHSYLASVGNHGLRFWNPRVQNKYASQLSATTELDHAYWLGLPKSQVEHLQIHESLTDYFHTRLRRVIGFTKDDFFRTHPEAAKIWPFVLTRLDGLQKNGLLAFENDFFRMTPAGRTLANRIFFELAFIEGDLL